MTRAAVARWWPFAVALVVQLIALYAPRAPSEGGDYHLDKVVHAGIFAAVVWTGRRARLPFWWLVLACAVHGPLSEWIQGHFLPHRDGNVPDALADLVGVAIGALLPLGRGRREKRYGRGRERMGE